MMKEQKPIYVAVESTRDYADVSFHPDTIEGNDYYRLVEMTDAGNVVPYERDKKYETAEAAESMVLGDPDYEVLSYDQLINKSVERQAYIKELTLQMATFGYKREIYEEAIEKPAFEHVIDDDDYRSFETWDEVQDTLQCKQALYDELTTNGLQKIEKNVITDLNAGMDSSSGSWMGRIVDSGAPANYLNVQITDIQRTGMISVQVDTVRKNKIVETQGFEVEKEDVLRNGVKSFENNDFLDRLKINSFCLETASKYQIDRVEQHFKLFQSGQKENSLREHCKWLKSNGYDEFPEGDRKAPAPASAQAQDKKINHEIKFNVPKGLTKTEFENTIKYFKENGAKYHADEKIWTIKESQQEKFAQYLHPEKENPRNAIAVKKIEAASQAPEERIRLNIPKNLNRDEFLSLIQHFKENGARYKPKEKVWTVDKSQKAALEKYIEVDTNQTDTDSTDNTTLKNTEEIKISEDELKAMDPESAENVRQFFRDNGGTCKENVWTIPKTAFDIETENDPEWMNMVENVDKEQEFTDKLDRLLKEYGYQKGYLHTMDIAQMIINGQNLQMNENENENKIQLNSSPSTIEEGREGSYIKGNYVSLHVPDYKRTVYEIKEVCGIKEISGQIVDETQDHLILEGKDGKEISIAKKEIYDDMQTNIIERAMSMDQNVRDQIDIIGNPKLSAAQMDQVLNGIKDGMHPLLVAQYANPKIPAWQMDIYRYGMLNGLGFDNIKAGCLQDWDSSRNNIDNMIKEQRGHIVSDLKANNYIPEKRLVHKLERLNGMTGGKLNKVSDIVNALKSGKISNRYGEASLLKEIGDDLQHQRKVMTPAAQQKLQAAAAVPTR